MTKLTLIVTLTPHDTYPNRPPRRFWKILCASILWLYMEILFLRRRCRNSSIQSHKIPGTKAPWGSVRVRASVVRVLGLV